ncbi:MAG TPA: hypothetical protein VKC17_02800 [Sphingomicrobium sp.]|nr:hypothetical protein [Sphingomicrobium sp.]
MSDDGPEWFAPKRYGFGSGMPIAWQGWAVTLAYLALAFGAALGFSTRPFVAFAILIPATVTLMVITARTTRGGWRWRWGDTDQG